MKKLLKRAILPTIVAMTITGTTYAAALTDVPANHWAYASVNQLVKAGLVDGYGDGSFKGEKTITRYEMAVIISKAIDSFDKADNSQKKEIDRLSSEFAGELNRMGVRIAKLEAKTKIAVSAETRLRFVGNSPGNVVNTVNPKLKGGDQFDFRQRFNFAADVNDSISFKARLAIGTSKLGTDTTSALGGDVRLDLMNVTAKHVLGMDSIRAGRTPLDFFSQGLFGKPMNVDGLTINNKFGETNFKAWTGVVKPYTTADNTNNQLTTAQLGWKLSDKLNVKAGYYVADINGSGISADPAAANYKAPSSQNFKNGLTYDSSKGYQASFDYKLGGLTVIGDYVATTLDNPSAALPKNPKAWAVELTNSTSPVKAMYPSKLLVNPTKPDTDAWSVSYRSVEPGAIPAGAGNFDTTAVAVGGAGSVNPNGTDNLKGWMLGYNRVLAKNVVWAVEYQTLKAKNLAVSPWSNSQVDKTYNTSIQFFY